MATQNLGSVDRNEQQRKTEGQDPMSSANPESRGSGKPESRGESEIERSASSTVSRMSNNPFVALRRMIEDVDRVFDNLGFGFPVLSSQGSNSLFEWRWAPELDVFESGGNLMIRVDLPGMRQEDIQIEVESGNVLVLSGERKHEQTETTGQGMWRSERGYGSFRRTMRLPRGMDIEQATARFDNGVLEISMPLPPEHQTRRIAIKGSEDKPGAPPKSSTSPVH